MMPINISIIIPTYQEADSIAELIQFLSKTTKKCDCEIIIVDGGSNDNTLQIAQQSGIVTTVVAPERGRAAQMNYGASIAKGNVFYFIHADTIPPPTFAQDIQQAIQEGYTFGRYQSKFKSNNLLLKLNAFFSRFDWFVCYGGDQTLYITAELFKLIQGFNDEIKIMEEYDLVMRAKTVAAYKIFKGKALISARKYDNRSWLAVQKANYIAVKMFKAGATQDAIVSTYKKMLHIS
jgi:rSAM/selenodomain-associated transferase 2